MLWSMDIVHRTRNFNVDSDYMSKLAQDTRFDPLLKQYLQSAAYLRSKYPPPTGEMTPETMPGYRRRRSDPASGDSGFDPNIDVTPEITIDGEPLENLSGQDSPADQVYASALLSTVRGLCDSGVDDGLSIYPVIYENSFLGDSPHLQLATTRSQAARNRRSSDPPAEPAELQNNDITSCARQLSRYQVVLYGLGGGHMHHSMMTNTLPLAVIAASDQDAHARSVMSELMKIPRIFICPGPIQVELFRKRSLCRYLF